MSDRVFIDTNVLVYCFDGAERAKQARALELLGTVLSGKSEAGALHPVVSTQVLLEFYVAVTRKLARPLGAGDAERAVEKLALLTVAPVDGSTVLSAIATCRRHQLSLWDALILQTALESGCSRVLTEDLQEGFELDGLVVENPFRRLA